MNFARPTDPRPLPAALAVKRGVRLINWPVWAIMFGGMGCAYLLVDRMPALALALGVLAIPAAWLWWSYFVPEWRRWALRNGADPVELQYLAECASLVWKQGSIFARTEIRRRR
jgi:hypothetical protein